ncbi:MAG TPA: hypothetical protein VHG90_12570 [Acidimicrobiales bacterium]|nr:hypothetical protein [Acidimicrobiales bacterium]
MRPRRSVVAVLLALALLTGVACGGGDDDEAQPSATTQAESPATTGAGGAAGRVTVEDAGREPRQRLELRLAPGSTTRAAMVSEVELDMSMEGNRLSAGALPTTRAVMEQRIDGVDPDGTAHFTVTIGDWSVLPTPGVDQAAVTETERALAELEGLRGTGKVDRSGGSQSLSMDTSSVRNPMMKATLDSFASQVGNLTVPFPSEPVGPGARWRASSTATINGITMNTTSTYTLRSRAGDRYELDVVQDAEAPPGPVAIPNLPAGTETSIESFAVHSTGKIAGELTKPLPVNSTVEGGGEGRLTVVAQGDRGTLVQRIRIDVVLSPA